MTSILRAATAILSLLSFAAGAAPLYFGELAPLTNTRYGAQPGLPELVSTGEETLLVWSTGANVRVARLSDGERRVAQLVMEATQRDADAVWTGSAVLVAASSDPFERALMGRLVDANGTPIGDVFQIQANAVRPKLASNGQRVLAIYQGINAVHAAVLSIDGRQVLTDEPIGVDIDDYDVASNGTGFTVVTTSRQAVRVLSFDANGVMSSSTTVTGARLPDIPREVAISSDGDDYLVVWTEGLSISAAEVSAAGTASAPIPLETTPTLSSTGAPAVVWAGDHYEVAYRALGSTAEIRVLDVRATVQRIGSIPATTTSQPSLAHAAGRTRVAWNGGRDLIRVRDTAGTGEGEPAAYGASEQTVMDAATTSVSTMFVWNEQLDDTARTYIGFRDRQGSWIERAIGSNLDRNAIAATNGADFMVVIGDATDWLAYRINGNGTLQGQPARIASRASIRTFDDMTWNGRHYVLAGIDTGGRVVAATLSSSGVMNPPMVVREPRENITLRTPSLASDGTNTLIAWSEIEGNPCFPICDFAIDGINAQLLGPNLQLLGESAVMIVDNDAAEPHVVWSTEYTIVWAHTPANTTDGSVRAQRIGRDGKRVGPAFVVVGGRNKVYFEVDAIGMRLGYALTWSEAQRPGRPGIITNVALVRPDGTVANDIALPPRHVSSSKLALLPDERVAHAVAVQHNAPPHHGASRILLAIGDVVPPIALPGPPRLIVRGTSTTAELEWTPPSGAVNGYRLEYRVGDGAWNELDRFHGPEQTTASIRLSGNRNISFRVRAFNDAGAGAYSVVGSIGAPRRRSVR